jgi:hypothetical protein
MELQQVLTDIHGSCFHRSNRAYPQLEIIAQKLLKDQMPD